MLAQKFKCGDVFIHVSFFHLQLFEFFSCTDIFSVVNEGILKPSFEDLPSILSRRDKSRNLVYTVKPVVHLLDPSFNFWSID